MKPTNREFDFNALMARTDLTQMEKYNILRIQAEADRSAYISEMFSNMVAGIKAFFSSKKEGSQDASKELCDFKVLLRKNY